MKEFAVVAKATAADHGGPAPGAAAPFIGAHVPFFFNEMQREVVARWHECQQEGK